MTHVTRRRLALCLVVAALTVPADLILVRAITTDAQSAATQWAASLTEAQLNNAAQIIDQYPLQYRKAIMKQMNPAARAQAWVGHIERFRDARPELTTEQVDALNAAIRVTWAALTSRNDANRVATRVAAERLTSEFGVEVAEYLMYRLGHRDLRILVNAAPWHHRLSDYVRSRFVVSAEAGSCNCNLDWGCDLLAMTWCNGNASCTIDNSWPACGWLWDETCNGVCWLGAVTQP